MRAIAASASTATADAALIVASVNAAPALLADIDRLTQERDLAVAHDRQPYPTAAAYEAVCAALHEREAERDTLAERVAWLSRVITEYGRHKPKSK